MPLFANIAVGPIGLLDLAIMILEMAFWNTPMAAAPSA